MKEGWIDSTLGEVCKFINGRNQKAVIDENGTYPIFGSAGNVMGFATEYLCKEGTVIIGRKGNISKPLFMNEKFWNVDTAFGIYPKDNLMLPKFNYYQCLNIDFASYNKGTTIPSLVKSDLIKIQVNYPKSLIEQQKIVEKLDTAFELIAQAKANIEKNIQNAKELFQSKLNDVFSQKGKGWEETNFGDVCDFINGRNQKEVISEFGEYPIYGSAGNIMGLATKYLCNGGTVIIGRKGNISKPIFVNHKFWNVDTAFGIYPKKGLITDKFNYYLCKNIDFASYNKGTTIPSLVKTDLQKIKVNFPKSLETQQKIVEKLDQLSAQTEMLQEKYAQKLANLEELKKSILEIAFKGELV